LKKQTKPVTVVWEDAVNLSNESLDDVMKRKPDLVKTYGILVKKNKSYHIVMTHDGGRGDNSDFMRVPTGIVREVIR